MTDCKQTTEPDDGEIEAIHEAAQEAAQQATPWTAAANPYSADAVRAGIWDDAFRSALHTNWH